MSQILSYISEILGSMVFCLVDSVAETRFLFLINQHDFNILFPFVLGFDAFFHKSFLTLLLSLDSSEKSEGKQPRRLRS
jgi:hypothetical protein